MPQLNINYLLDQYYSFLISFIILYYTIILIVLPGINKIFVFRNFYGEKILLKSVVYNDETNYLIKFNKNLLNFIKISLNKNLNYLMYVSVVTLKKAILAPEKSYNDFFVNKIIKLNSYKNINLANIKALNNLFQAFIFQSFNSLKKVQLNTKMNNFIIIESLNFELLENSFFNLKQQ